MPPLPPKNKVKPREGRRSLSRNTTPSSAVSAPTGTEPQNTTYLNIPIADLSIPTDISYDDLLERHGGGGGIPDPKHLESMANDLKTLSQLADRRSEACDSGMRESGKRRKIKAEEDRLQELADREAAEKARVKKQAQEDEEKRKLLVQAKKRKESNAVREERPPAHGAHGLARQDGKEKASKEPDPEASEPARKARKKHTSPPTVKRNPTSGSSSSLSPPSLLQSPMMATHQHQTADVSANRVSPGFSDSSVDEKQPLPAPGVVQYNTFGDDPLTFDDPTIYHIRPVRADMTDEEKKEIYNVASFPKNDLSHFIAGVPANKDFSNAKPANQVNANTFLSHVEPYLRPLTEEDMAFLKERGDRVTPFLIPRFGKRHYTEIWAEEDGAMSVDGHQQHKDKLPPNQARGSVDQIDDEIAETEQVSAGPVLNRLLAAMRFENRSTTNEDCSRSNGFINGDGLANGHNNDITDATTSDALPPATYMPESNNPAWKTTAPKIDYATADERVKQELRYLGLLAPDTEPDFDAHNDDDIAARLRVLQAQLKETSIQTGAMKARILDYANERMAYQEYSTIEEDLDAQVQQAYLKRSRTMGKGKKNVKRPGGAGGGSHYVNGAGPGAGVTKPGIGDVAKSAMERRKKWGEKIGPIFEGDVMRVRGKDESIFGEEIMEKYVKEEKERWDEEAE